MCVWRLNFALYEKYFVEIDIDTFWVAFKVFLFGLKMYHYFCSNYAVARSITRKILYMFSFPLSVDGYCLFKRKIKLSWKSVCNKFIWWSFLKLDEINSRSNSIMQRIWNILTYIYNSSMSKNCNIKFSLSKLIMDEFKT